MRQTWLRRVARRKITLIVSRENDTITLHGVLWEVLKDGVLLRSVQVETPEGRQDMGGEVWVPRERIFLGQDMTGAQL